MARVPAGLSLPRDAKRKPSPITMDQTSSVASPLLVLRMLCSRKVLYKSLTVPASIEHSFFFLTSPEEAIEQEV